MLDLWQRELDEQRDAIARGEPVQVNVRDETLAWKRVEAIVVKGALEDGQPAAVLQDRGEVTQKGEWSVRILRELGDEAYIFTR